LPIICYLHAGRGLVEIPSADRIFVDEEQEWKRRVLVFWIKGDGLAMELLKR